ncbi:MAG: oligosaccharide flippase family protein [Desulfobacterota bacterium]|nr:oligosaccharide flippase family protein [Thermodesulfobacteriota bacterium]
MSTASAEYPFIAKKLFIGSGFRIFGFVLTRLIQVVQIFIFARLFTPHDIGTATLAGSCIAIASVFANFGFFPCIIRDRENNAPFINTAFLLSAVIGLGVFFAVWVSAPYIEYIVAADLCTYLRFLAIMVLSIPMRFPIVFWEKELRFGQPAAALCVQSLAQLVVSIIVELVFRTGIWSLLIGNVAGFLISCCYVWLYAMHRPSIQWHTASAKKIMRFGTPFMLQGINSEAMMRGDNLMVGVYAGTPSLAYYNFAWQLPMLIAAFMNTLDAMLFPVYAQLNESREGIQKLFNFTSKLWSIAGSFIGCFILVYADTLVLFLYGSHWAPVIPLLRIMTVSFIVRFCSGYAYDNLALVRGRTPYLMKWGVINTLLIFSLGLYMIKKCGPEGGAWFWVVQAVVLIPLIRLPLIYQELRSLAFVKHVWQPVLCGVGAGLCGFFLNQREGTPLSIERLVSIAFYSAAYGVLLVLIDRSFVADIKKIIKLVRE